MNWEAVARIQRTVGEEVGRLEERIKEMGKWIEGLAPEFPGRDYHEKRLAEMREAADQMREFASVFGSEKWRQIKTEFSDRSEPA